jgi:hypothetical protein
MAPDGERVCVDCGCVAEAGLVSGHMADTHEGADPHSFDNGLGSEPLRTIKEVRFNSSLLKNSWQTVLGYYMHGQRDPFVESCMRDLAVALDGTSDEQFVQCRRLLLKQIGRLKDRGLGRARMRTRQTVVQLTLEEAAQTWPRIAMLRRGQAGRGEEEQTDP